MEHIWYKNKQLRQSLPNDTVFVTSFRQPLSRLASDLNYHYAMFKNNMYNKSIDLLDIIS